MARASVSARRQRLTRRQTAEQSEHAGARKDGGLKNFSLKKRERKARETPEKRSFFIAQSEHAGARKVGVDSTSVCGLKLLGLVV